MKKKHDPAGSAKPSKARPSSEATSVQVEIPGLQPMIAAEPKVRYSAFTELGFKQTIEALQKYELPDGAKEALGNVGVELGGKQSTTILSHKSD